jgi:hypothetical protein
MGCSGSGAMITRGIAVVSTRVAAETIGAPSSVTTVGAGAPSRSPSTVAGAGGHLRRRDLGGVLAPGRRLLRGGGARRHLGHRVAPHPDGPHDLQPHHARPTELELRADLLAEAHPAVGLGKHARVGDLDALHGQQAEVELVLLPRPPLLIAAVGLVLAGLLLGAGLLFGRRVAHRVELLAQRLEDELLLVGVDPLGLATEHMAPQPLQLHHRQLLELAVLLQVVRRDRQRVAQALLLGRDVRVLFHERIALPEERVTLLREGGHQRPKIVGGRRATRVVRPAR